jgi:hypothetical protein
MFDSSVQDMIEAYPDVFRNWRDDHWQRFKTKLAFLESKGFVTGKGILFMADAVNNELPRPSEPEPIAPPSTTNTVPSIQPQTSKEGIAAISAQPAIEGYAEEIRVKFEAVMRSHHQRTVASLVEALYRDLVYYKP